jgi:hypothetical protein
LAKGNVSKSGRVLDSKNLINLMLSDDIIPNNHNIRYNVPQNFEFEKLKLAKTESLNNQMNAINKINNMNKIQNISNNVVYNTTISNIGYDPSNSKLKALSSNSN